MALRLYRLGQGRRGLAAGLQQLAAIGLCGQFFLQQGFDPRLRAGVACQQKRIECRGARGGRLAAAGPHQSHGAALALAGVGVAQGVGAVQAQQGFDGIQHVGVGGMGGGSAKQHAAALAAKRHTGGKCKLGHQGAQGFAHRVGFVIGHPAQGQQGPGQVCFVYPHRRVFELGLFGGRAVCRGGERVHASQRQTVRSHAAEEFAAPVHGHEELAQPHFVAGLHRHHKGAAFAGHADQVTLGKTPAGHVLRVHVHGRLGHVTKQAAQCAGAAHAVPLVTQAAGGERERKLRFARFRHRPVRHSSKPGLAIGGGKHAIGVQPHFAPFEGHGVLVGLPGDGGAVIGQRPLLRAVGVDHGVTQSGDVQVAPPGAFTVLVPDGFGRGVREEGGLAGAQGKFHTLRKKQANLPVVPGPVAVQWAGGIGGS